MTPRSALLRKEVRSVSDRPYLFVLLFVIIIVPIFIYYYSIIEKATGLKRTPGAPAAAQFIKAKANIETIAPVKYESLL